MWTVDTFVFVSYLLVTGDAWSVPVCGGILLTILAGFFPGNAGYPAIKLQADPCRGRPEPDDPFFDSCSDTETEDSWEISTPVRSEPPTLLLGQSPAKNFSEAMRSFSITIVTKDGDLCSLCGKQLLKDSVRFGWTWQEMGGVTLYFHPDCFITWVVQEGLEESATKVLLDQSELHGKSSAEVNYILHKVLDVLAGVFERDESSHVKEDNEGTHEDTQADASR